MSSDGSDGYECDSDYDPYDEIIKRGNKTYKDYVDERTKVVLKTIKDDGTLEERKVYVKMFTDDDCDKGLLDGYGGYYEVSHVSEWTKNLRRNMISTVIYRHLMEKSFFEDGEDELQVGDMFQVLKLNDIEFKKSTEIIPFDKLDWFDFKIFLSQKYMRCSDLFLQRKLRSCVIDVYNLEYTQFLLSKGRYLLHTQGPISGMEELKKLGGNFVTAVKTDTGSIENVDEFIRNLSIATKSYSDLHIKAFKSFVRLYYVPENPSIWSNGDYQTYERFIKSSNSVSYLEIDTMYNINYTSKRSGGFTKKYRDSVLAAIKTLLSRATIKLTEVCKSYKKLGLINRSLGRIEDLDSLFLLLHASGCNYKLFGSVNEDILVIQTVLNNLIIFTTPVKMLDNYCSRLHCSNDIAFHQAELTLDRSLRNNPLYKGFNVYSRKAFGRDTEVNNMQLFLINYYSRLSNVTMDDLESWVKKTTKLKSRLLSSTHYVRYMCATKIQRMFRFVKSQFGNPFNIRPVIRFAAGHIKKQEEKETEHDNWIMSCLFEDKSSVVITRFLRRIPSMKECRPFQVLLREMKHKKREIKQMELRTLIKDKEMARERQTSFLIARKTDYRIDSKRALETLVNKMTELESGRIDKRSTRLHINVGIQSNNKKKWFGFDRNHSLTNMVLAAGFPMDVLDIKTKYTRVAFCRIVEVIGKICMVTKSRQFLKLCRMFSGRKHEESCLSDFIGGFCWMFDNLTVWKVLHQASVFCSITNNHRWYTFLVNNIGSLEASISLMSSRV